MSCISLHSTERLLTEVPNRYVQVVKRKGIRVAKVQEMIVSSHRVLDMSALTCMQGSYSPNTVDQPFYEKKCK